MSDRMSTQLLMAIWLAIICMVTCKPLHTETNLSDLLGDKISPNLQDKAEAIDTLLQLLSEIDLPSICDAISAQKKNPQMQTVDAILAEVAKSQAMTFIPTNLPETVDVTRPGDAPVAFLDNTKKPKVIRPRINGKVKSIFLGRDAKQASQEVTISRAEGGMGLSLDKAAALKSRKQQINKTNLDSSDITVDVSVRAPASKNLPSKNHHVPTTPRPPQTTFKLSALTTISTPVTTPTTDKSVKKDTTIPTLSSDMMLPDGSFESGDGEITMETFTTEKYTTSKLEDEAYTKTDMFESTFDNILKNIFKYQDEKDLDLKKASPDTDKPILALNQLTKEASFEPSNSSNYTKEALVHSLPTTVDHTPLINESNSLTTVDKLPNSDYSDETILPTPSADDDLSFTLPSNTTLAQYIFGNTTLDDNYSNDLAFILNSTLPLDYLISNDTLYNEFMSIINETLSYDEIIKQANMSIDMALHETGDYQNLIDYISNMTAVLDTEANYTSPPEITAYHTTHGIKINTDDGNATTTQTTKTSAKKVAKNTSTTFAAKINTKPARSSTVNTRARVTDPARFEYADSSAPQYSAVQEKEHEHEGHRHNYPQKTDFAAGDYYSNEDQDIERNSNNNQVTKPFKHSGFAPVNLDDSYKKNARHAGLSYLGFDFKHINRSPYTPKSENSEVAQLVNQKTIWSESTQKHVTSPAGYSCPGLFGYYGDAHNCKAFFICSWGVPYRFHCPTGTMWSSKESVCDWNRNVICHESK